MRYEAKVAKIRAFLSSLVAIMALAPGAEADGQTLQRSPNQRQNLLQLAYALGETHALHRLCAGPGDGLWYRRMKQLEAQEQADEGFRRRLVESFNAGFVGRQGEFASCSSQSRAAEQAAAGRGAALAAKLARGGN
jgi:uncharacterized protein (TIGR02301 family)